MHVACGPSPADRIPRASRPPFARRAHLMPFCPRPAAAVPRAPASGTVARMKRHRVLLGIVLVLVATAGCKKKQATTTEPAGSGSAVATGSDTGGSAGSAGSDTGSAVELDAGAGSAAAAGAPDPGELATPESVYYDVGRDMYMISSINGTAAGADDNGYLTVVNPDGSNARANANWRWIDGQFADIKLDAPKGMAISGDTLYVADITVVRRFEAKSGKQLADIAIPGATFLNDVVADGGNGVFVSDTGVDASFKPAGTDAIYHITEDGKLTTRIKGKHLDGPNGVWATGKDMIWVVTFGSNELYMVDEKGMKGNVTKLPKGQLDGIVRLDDGDFLIASWEGKCVYRGKPGGEWKEVISDVESPADIAYDPKRKRLLIPGFNTNKLTVHQL